MSSMTKDEINTSLFDEVKQQRDEIERLTARVEVLEEVCIEREADCIELEDENKRLTSENELRSAVIDAARNLSDGCTFPCDPIEGELHNRLDEALAAKEKDDG